MGLRRRRGGAHIDVWPGFVDALASILLVFIFMLLIFVVGQYFLSKSLIGRDLALTQLQQEINSLGEALGLEIAQGEKLEQKIVQLQGEEQHLNQRLQVEDERRRELEFALTALNQKYEKSNVALSESRDQQISDQKWIADLEQRSIALLALKKSLEDQVSTQLLKLQQLEGQLTDASQREQMSQTELSRFEQREHTLQTDLRLAEERELQLRMELLTQKQNSTSQQKVVTSMVTDRERLVREIAQLQQLREQLRQQAAELADRIRILEESNRSERSLSVMAGNRIALLQQQLSELRQQLDAVASTLVLSQREVESQKVELSDLGARLNLELASKVKKLTQYRSEFFGRLRESLGDHPDLQVVGDRFVLQSELLFASGEAELGLAGQQQMRKLASTLLAVSAKIPADIDWIVRVDGHTDRRAINNEFFASNWELSSARAITIVRFMMAAGIPAQRLAATGFAEYHPLDNAQSEAAFSRNRRIEIKLTNR